MLNLSDDLKIHYSFSDEYLNTVITYTVKLCLYQTGYTPGDVIYTGQIFYSRPSDLYFKDIVLPYITNYDWFRNRLSEFTSYDDVMIFKVLITFSNGVELLSEEISNTTTVPTINPVPIPSILPVIRSVDSPFFFSWTSEYDSSYILGASGAKYNETTNTGHNTASAAVLKAIQGSETSFNIITLQNIDGSQMTSKSPNIQYDHNSRYYLIWITRSNSYLCRPFCSKNTLNETVSTSYITDLNSHNRPYLKESTFKWTLNSDWLSFIEHNEYESLLISPYVYLYDNELDKMHSVNITDSSWSFKNNTNTKRPFNLTVNLELNKKQNNLY